MMKAILAVLLTSVVTVGGFAAKETYGNSLKIATLEQVVKDFSASQTRMENKIDFLIENAISGN